MKDLLLRMELALAKKQALKDMESESDSSNSSLTDNFGGLF